MSEHASLLLDIAGLAVLGGFVVALVLLIAFGIKELFTELFL